MHACVSVIVDIISISCIYIFLETTVKPFLSAKQNEINILCNTTI